MFFTDWLDCICSMNFLWKGSLIRKSTWNNFKWMFDVFSSMNGNEAFEFNLYKLSDVQIHECMDIKVCNFTFHHTHQSNLSSKSALHLVFWQFFFLSWQESIEKVLVEAMWWKWFYFEIFIPWTAFTYKKVYVTDHRRREIATRACVCLIDLDSDWGICSRKVVLFSDFALRLDFELNSCV